jgi:signal transduction histidine kinase
MISVQFPDDLPLVNIDSGRIEVVLHNLVANASVYGEGEAHGGVIWAESSLQGTTIFFSLPLVSPAIAQIEEGWR